MKLRITAGALVVLLLLGGGWIWFRDSRFARVTDVYILGATSSEKGAINAALRRAALDMSTLNLRVDQLETAVAPYDSVKDLTVTPDFPHKLTIEVHEHRPVAALVIGGQRLPVGGDGVVLRGVRAQKGLPQVRTRRVPADGRLDDRRALTAVAVLAAAPDPLTARVERAWFGPRGLTLDLRRGPDLVFGGEDEAEAKWAAAARVLAEPSAVGATYLDLRVPERVAAGGLQPVPSAEPQA